MRSNNPYLFIVSTQQGTEFKPDDHSNARGRLQVYGFKPYTVRGSYQGSNETSILVFADSLKDVSLLKQLVNEIALKYNQECFLESDNERKTRLVYPVTGSSEYIGVFKQIDSESTNYTAFNGIKYGTVKE